MLVTLVLVNEGTNVIDSKALQPENIPSMLVTLAVLNELRLRDFNDEQDTNIRTISVTLAVLNKGPNVMDSNSSHPENISLIFVIFLVSNELRSRDFKLCN
jgi:hypothetical protein